MYVLCLEFKSWFVKIGLLVLLLFPGDMVVVKGLFHCLSKLNATGIYGW